MRSPGIRVDESQQINQSLAPQNNLPEIREMGNSASPMSISIVQQQKNLMQNRSPNQVNQEMSGTNLEPTYNLQQSNVHMTSMSKVSMSNIAPAQTANNVNPQDM